MFQNMKILTAKQCSDLLNHGYVSLPQLKNDVISDNDISELIESKDKIYTSSTDFHMRYVNKYKIDSYLKDDLRIIAKTYYKKNLEYKDTYKITRITKGSQESESYLGHFDSHLFTLVTPIVIPETDMNESGQLIIFPKIRNEPRNELINIIGKVLYKKFNTKEKFSNLMKKYKHIEFDFKDNDPIIFLGRVTLHANKGFSSAMNSHRITLLTHFFDPSPKYGIGNILRLLRAR